MYKAILFFTLVLLISCGPLRDINGIKDGTTMNLSRKGLSEIPVEVFENKNLKVLKLYGNNIKEISERIGELVNLEKLYIGRNDLSSLPNAIGNLKKLKV